MKKILNENQVIYILNTYEDYKDYIEPNNRCWEVTDDKSFDTIRSESDDKFYPYVLLRDGLYFDAITEYTYNKLMELENE